MRPSLNTDFSYPNIANFQVLPCQRPRRATYGNLDEVVGLGKPNGAFELARYEAQAGISCCWKHGRQVVVAHTRPILRIQVESKPLDLMV